MPFAVWRLRIAGEIDRSKRGQRSHKEQVLSTAVELESCIEQHPTGKARGQGSVVLQF